MKVSRVWTASALLVVILLESGCVQHRVASVQPMKPAVQPGSQTSPAIETRVVAPVSVAPPVQPETRSASPTVAARNSTPEVPRPKPESAKPAKPREIIVTDAPPPPQIEVVGAAPGAEYVWVPGAWQWRERWVWSGGYWAVRPQADAAWVKGRWVKRDQGWAWIRGYWR
jgi:hypothetical protein